MLGGLDQQLASMGFHLPQDLDVVLGTKFDVAFGGIGADGMPQVGVTSNADAAQAGRVLDRLTTQLDAAGAPFTLHHVRAGKGYAAALSHGATRDQLAAGGHLGDQRPSRPPCRTRSRRRSCCTSTSPGWSTAARREPSAPAVPVDPNLKALSARRDERHHGLGRLGRPSA